MKSALMCQEFPREQMGGLEGKTTSILARRNQAPCHYSGPFMGPSFR